MTTTAPTVPTVPALATPAIVVVVPPPPVPAPVPPPLTAPAPVTTTAPTAPAPVPPAPVPPPAPEPVAASRRSVHLLAAAVGGLTVACLLYVLVDRPVLREPLVDVAAIVAAATGVAGLVRGASRPPR
ncbi:hypothetical protein [Streptomyces sp. EN16]|uniref:hypothetical protein n=1 Tax=Streptomyces sp. EN16 TaxID=212773 RepID=UPI0008515F7B|nr:hypothetical protein [Streptomyces sp. EN16]